MRNAVITFHRETTRAVRLGIAAAILLLMVLSGTGRAEEYLWEFDKDQFAGWKYDGVAFVEPSQESLKIEVSRGNPHFFSPRVEIDSLNQRSVVVHMKLPVGIKSKGCILFVTEDRTEWSDELAVNFECRSNGEWSEYVIDMSASPHWKGKVTELRFQPFYCDWPLPADERTVELKSFGIPIEN